MRLLKKLRMCLCMALVGTMLMATTANAAEPLTWFLDERDTYTQTISDVKYNYTKEQKKACINQCEVINPEMYLDDTIKKYATQGLGAHFKMYDLRYLADFGLYSLKCGENKAFNYGFIKTDDFLNPSYIYVFCKCSNKDFKDFMNYHGYDVTQENYSEFEINVDGHKWLIDYNLSPSPKTSDMRVMIDY